MATPGTYLVKHAVKPYGADHWLLVLDGHDPIETDNATFVSGDKVVVADDGSISKYVKPEA